MVAGFLLVMAASATYAAIAYIVESLGGSCTPDLVTAVTGCSYKHSATGDVLAYGWLTFLVLGVGSAVWSAVEDRLQQAETKEHAEPELQEVVRQSASPSSVAPWRDSLNTNLFSHIPSKPRLLLEHKPCGRLWEPKHDGYHPWQWRPEFTVSSTGLLVFPLQPEGKPPTYGCQCGKVLRGDDLRMWELSRKPWWFRYLMLEQSRRKTTLGEARRTAVDSEYQTALEQAFVPGNIPRPMSPAAIREQLAKDDHLRWEVFETDDYACRKCGSRRALTIDHITPVSRGGNNERSNLQTLCRPCNSRKGAKVTS